MSRKMLLLCLFLGVAGGALAHGNSATVAEAPDTTLPAIAATPAAATAPSAMSATRTNDKITIYTARKIVTMDPM